MKLSFFGKFVATAIISAVAFQASADSTLCNGKFPNPITDYCWSSVFPIKIAGASIDLIGGQEDKSSNTDAICTCGSGASMLIGVTTSFWEPNVMVDVVRKPFCLSGLGGIDMGNVIDAPPAGFSGVDGGAVTTESFYQLHWYQNPILFWLDIIVDNSCLDNLPFELSYLTELDPLWNDEEVTTLLAPDSYLYANPLAQLACAGDCVTASAGFPNAATYWCAGCQGALFPLTGVNSHHSGAVDSSSLLLQKFTHKAHRELMIWGASGKSGLCYKYPKYLMDRTDYKYSMLFPVPQKKINGLCSQPYGRTTALWGSGKSFPYYGKMWFIRCSESVIAVSGRTSQTWFNKATIMKRILLTTSVCIALLSNNTFANPSQQELDKVKESNVELMGKAVSSYQHSKPSMINLGNIPLPQSKLEGSLTEKAMQFSNGLSKLDLSKAPEAKLKLFISFSMSDQSITKYIKEANRLGRNNISLAIIGFKSGLTMRETAEYISNLTKGYNVSVEIDPPSFERFAIKNVPALVVYYDDPLFEAKCAVGKQPEKMKGIEEYWEGTLGDVSMTYSIDKLLDNPDSKFKDYLERLSSKLKGNNL